MEMVIKKFEELNNVELYDVMELRSEIFVVEQKCAYQDCDGKDKDAYHLLVKDGGEIAGYLRILQKGQSFREVSIGRVAVSQSHRGKQIARKMMQKAMQFVVETMKEEEIQISAQEYLVNFYQSLGFKANSGVYLEDGIPHVNMFYKAHDIGRWYTDYKL